MKNSLTIMIMMIFASFLVGQDSLQVPGEEMGLAAVSGFDDPNSWKSFFVRNLKALLWATTAAIGFGLGVGISLKVFDWLSTDIDEWEEIKKGNMGVSLIFVSLIVMVGLIVHKVI